MIGRTLGHYRIVEQIGVGGMATVYKAYDPDTDRYVALKVLPQHFSQDPPFRERFHREAKAIARLEHLHILPIYAYGEDEGIVYMAMRYLQAGTLTDRIRQGPLPLPEVSRVLNQVASALDYAHSEGILHRDIKPSNILLDRTGNAFLTDFGIAKMVEATLNLTGGALIGTPTYMSPEQCRGSRELTPASDQYALGIVLYEMVTGRTPFVAETPIALIYMQLNNPLPPPCQLRPDLPDEVQRVILKTLAKEPESRYASCSAMAAAFAETLLQAGVGQPQPAAAPPTLPLETPSAPTVSQPEEVTLPHLPGKTTGPIPVSRRPLRRLGWGLAVITVVSLILAALWLFKTGERLQPLTVRPATQVASEPAKPASTAGPVTPTAQPPLISPPPATQEKTEPAGPAPSPGPALDPGQPPASAQRVSCCTWEGAGQGLCIYEGQRRTPTKLLAKEPLQIDGGVGWSPDGQQLVFSALEPGTKSKKHGVYVVNRDGSDLTKLPLVDNDITPIWSPDGNWLAFHGDCDLVVMRPDGSDRKHIWHHRNESACTCNPQWSPDSRRLVFTLAPAGEWVFPVKRTVQLISLDGSGAISLLTTVFAKGSCPFELAAFSPNGQQIAYYDETCRPALANADGSGQPTRLAHFPTGWLGNVYPQWDRP